MSSSLRFAGPGCGQTHNGKKLNQKSTTQACYLLSQFKPHIGPTFPADKILFELVPKPDHSCSDILVFFESHRVTKQLLQYIVGDIRAWQNERQVVRMRGQLILTKLREEGLMDEIELQFRCRGYDNDAFRDVFVGAQLIHILGGNAPFWAERLN
ncbi:hypothetical protein BLNAU_9754 [Blattamonas nauphoetae]|uniref:Uncharacterized protein n=1 Tax=Blattamonas nauphoetae TaxID=2049346 RepID=A0ABQ9XV60_9EUKA|nr:hypothetical protein BLNAU_9754 [Blattamonas nauphoetae]